MLSDRHHAVYLLEYQAKALLQEMGVTLLPAQNLQAPADVRDLRLPYPIVLKSQVRASNRARAGGIRFATNAIDAFAAARAIFNLAIEGQYPDVLLAEARFRSERQYYLAAILDDGLQRPVLIGAPLGEDGQPTACYRVAIEAEFSPFYARRLSLRLGLSGQEMLAVSAVAEKLYRLLVAKDLVGVEIDPLAIAANGEVAILDAKIRADRRTLGRHPDIAAWLPDDAARPAGPGWPGETGGLLLASNCESLLLAMGDWLLQSGYARPLGTLLVGAGADLAALVARIRGFGIVLANFGSDAATTTLMAEALAAAGEGQQEVVFRVAGGPPAPVRERLLAAGLSIRWCEGFEDAIAAALILRTLRSTSP